MPNADALWVVFFCIIGTMRVEGRQIVVVGDLHGDLNQTLAILKITGLVDDRQHWIGGDSFFVQLGDIFDVGPDDISIVKLLMKLEKEAQSVGGDVIELLGNHEIRNLLGDYSAVDPGSLAGSGGVSGRDRLLSNRTSVGMYLRTRKAIFHHNEFLFMHGGLSTATASIITGIDKIHEFNKDLRKALTNGTLTPLGSTGLNLAEGGGQEVVNPILVRSILNVRCKDLIKVLQNKFAGIKSVVVGHVPHNHQDFKDWRLCGGHLIAIDFGLSRWKKGDPGHVAALQIDDTTGHVQLLESTVRFPEFSADEHPVDRPLIGKWFPVIERVSVVVIILVSLVFIGKWAVSFICGGNGGTPGNRRYGTFSPV
ncbi:kinetoplastid-specific phospho-protein phosphatase, putative [Trypanosoma equiperdum]|uniref:Serine/threonine protein phosphatase, putative n=3 Tax=Trypanozoon TaxID=39700 RepID=Q587C9_TRYB2|nr:serine/threonine protein phosphatase, putative [Trypanosoma brucei brucei TREU927]AAX79248.1 serine/threonine protein phosphatase, putative [Trypanosoma brucei]AAZ12021.1 serine/threonine protein phosphatase, putative [Trypanosoma brucei brucei TREU927]RHW71855.1 kinetoplastid-specific phospho-protein phosphatase [Trypanosoma brucei equiperdum]SCU66698.1 kinetoplastid-specific phospho-protein phosphatase, putative [Trypanosoma equiperdum]